MWTRLNHLVFVAIVYSCWTLGFVVTLVPEISIVHNSGHSIVVHNNAIPNDERDIQWPFNESAAPPTQIPFADETVTPTGHVSLTIDDNFDIVDPEPSSSTQFLQNKVPVILTEKDKHRWDKKDKAAYSAPKLGSSDNNKPLKSTSKSALVFWEKNNYDIFPTHTPQQVDAESCDVPATCPPFQILERRQQYDIRSYPAHKWASTIVMTENRLLAQWEGLAKLQEYFTGHNEQGLVMNTTLPLLTQIKYGRHPGVLHELRDTTLSLPIPALHQANPSLPISDDILVDVVDTSTIFVQPFRARLWELTDRAMRQRVDKFMTTLRNHGEAFYDRYYYLASYTRSRTTILSFMKRKILTTN